MSVEVDAVELPAADVIAHRHDPAVAYVGYPLDRLGRPIPLAGNVGVERPDPSSALTAFHEPLDEEPAVEMRTGLLTPTELAGRAADDEAFRRHHRARRRRGRVGFDRHLGAAGDLAAFARSARSRCCASRTRSADRTVRSGPGT